MRRVALRTLLALPFAFGLLLQACTRRDIVGVVVGSIEVAPPTAVVQAGDSLRLVAMIRDDRGALVGGVPAEWSSAAPSVLVVSAGGVVRGLQVGVADVTATFGGKLGSARVVVTPGPAFELAITQSAGSTIVWESGATDTLAVRLLAQPVSDVVVRIASADTGAVAVDPPSLRFGPSDWSLVQLAVVRGVDDEVVDGQQVTEVTLSVDSALSDPAFAMAPAVSIGVATQDDESAGVTVAHTSGSTVVAEGGAVDSISVTLTGPPASNVVLRVLADVPGDLVVDSATLTFTPAGPISRWVTVAAVDDPDLDGDLVRTVTVSVDAASDPLFRGLASQSMPVTTLDDDVAGYVVSETSSATIVGEGGSTDVFTVVLTARPSAPVLFQLTSSDLTEVAVSPTTLVFTSAAWNQPQAVTVIGVDDATGDGDQQAQVTVTVDPSSAAGFVGLPAETLAVTNVDDDRIGFSVTETSGTVVNESGSLNDAIAIRLNTIPVGNVVLVLSSADPGEVVVSPQTLTFTSLNGGQAQAVVVAGVNDQVVDGDVVTAVAVSIDVVQTEDPAYDSVSARIVNVTTLDDETPDVIVAEAGGSTSVDESGATDVFTVVLGAQPLSNVVLSISNSDPGEVLPDSASLTFTPANWSTPKVVTVIGVDDAVDDGDAVTPVVISVEDAMSDALWHSVTDKVVLVTTREVPPSIDVTQSGGSTTVSEGGSSDSFTVVLGSRPTANVLLTLSVDHPAEATVDSATLTFTPTNWSSPKTVLVLGVDDAFVDGPRSSTVTISVATGSDAKYVVLAPTTVAVTTTDDEVAGFSVTQTGGATVVDEVALADTLNVVLSAQPLSGVVLAVIGGDPGEVAANPTSLAFTPANWSTPRTVIVTGVADGVEDGDQVSLVTVAVDDGESDDLWDPLANRVVSVTTLDVTAGLTVVESGGSTSVDENGTVDAFSIALSEQPASDVVLLIASADPGEVIADSTSLTFTPSTWSTPVSVTVMGVDDPTVDGPQSTAISIAVAIGSDPAFATLPPRVVFATTTDDDVAAFSVTPTGAGSSVGESGTTDTLTVVLSAQPLSDVTLGIASNDIGEVAVDSASVTFTPATWSTPKVVTLRGVNDDIADGVQSAVVTVSVGPGSDPAFSGLGVQNVSVQNVDNEIASFAITQTQGSTVVGEGGTTDTFTVVLLSRPTSSVTITISNPDPTEVSVAPVVISIPPGQWNSPRTVTVTGVNDALVDGDQVTQLLVAVDDATSNDVFDAAPDQVVSVTTLDDDQ